MKVTIPYSYTKSVIPKRCRKPRDVKFDSCLDVTVREVTENDAPVAIIEHDSLQEDNPLCFRWFDGKLWTNSSAFRRCDGLYGDAIDYFRSDGYKTELEVTAQLYNCADSMIIINGQTFRTAGEPRYVIMTFGLGRNHGGTALMTDYSYNQNINKSRYYRIDQREEAIVEAERIAIARGDTEDVPIKPHANFDIFIPESIQINPVIEHGDGDPFLNSIENVVESVKDTLIAGLFAISRCYN